MKELQAKFKTHSLGPVTDLLGVQIQRDRANPILKLNQAKHINDLLARAGMEDCSTEPTPVASGAIFSKQDCPTQAAAQDQEQRKQAKWYRSVVASCIHLSVWTRPDIAFAVSKLCKFMSNPGPVHVKQLKRLLRYLKGTVALSLTYDFSTKPVRRGIYGYHD